MGATSTEPVTIADLAAIVGDKSARRGEAGDAVNGVVPRMVVAPGNVGEAQQVMALAGRHGLAVAPRGAGTKIDWGNPPPALDLVVETRRLDRVVAHEAGDLVVIAEAGVTLDAVQETVGQAGQMLGIDSVHPGATLGGIVATNSTGPRRLRYGAVRDLLIGITVILPDGTVAKSGGKVVKNVAGYDLGKLFTGSFGTLGLIVETTFRLHAGPRAREVIVVDVNDAHAVGECLQALLNSPLVPSAVELEWARDSGRLLVLFEGIEAGCARQAESAAELARNFGPARIAGEVERDELLDSLARVPWTGDEAGIKIVTLPNDVPAILTAIEGGAQAAGISYRLTGHAATSVLLAAFSGPADAICRFVAEVRGRIEPIGAVVTIVQASLEVKRSIDIWGYAGAALPVMRRIKERFDPGRIMSPGRFVGGI